MSNRLLKKLYSKIQFILMIINFFVTFDFPKFQVIFLSIQ